MLSNKKLQPTVTKLLIRSRKMNTSFVFITQSYFLVLKSIKLDTLFYYKNSQTNESFKKLQSIIRLKQIVKLTLMSKNIKCNDGNWRKNTIRYRQRSCKNISIVIRQNWSIWISFRQRNITFSLKSNEWITYIYISSRKSIWKSNKENAKRFNNHDYCTPLREKIWEPCQI